MKIDETERRQGAEIERQLVQIERRLLLGGFYEAANLVGAAAISLSEYLGIIPEDERDEDDMLGEAAITPLARPRRLAVAQRGKR